MTRRLRAVVLAGSCLACPAALTAQTTPPAAQAPAAPSGGAVPDAQGALGADQAAAAANATGSPTQSGEQAGDIVVTAQKRSESVQRVPIAITAIGGQRLQQLDVRDVQDLTAYVPSFRVTQPGDPAVSALSLRGVGQRDINVHNEGAVAVFVDQAYVSFIPAVAQPVFDVERIEVLKGPQGTLFGRNATGGLISIISAKPTDTPEGYGILEYGSYDEVKAEAAVSGPLAPHLDLRASALYTRDDGYIHNRTGPDLNADNSLAGRLQLLWKPTDRFRYDFELRAWRFFDSPGVGVAPSPFIQDASGVIRRPANYAEYAAFCAHLDGGVAPPVGAEVSGNCFTNQPNRFDASAGPEDRFNQSYYAFTGTGEWQLSDNITLNSITDYQHLSNNFVVDEDATVAPIFDYQINVHGSDQVSQELRLNGSTPGLKWVAGLYYLSIDHDITNVTDLYDHPGYGVRLPADYQQHTESYAVFGQADIDFARVFTLSLGLRGIHDYKSLHNVSTCQSNPLTPPQLCAILGTAVFPGAIAFNQTYDGSFSKNSWSGRAVLQWKPTSTVMVYGGVTRGTKGGGFNSGGAEFYPASAVEFQPETLTSYEIGAKASTTDRVLSVDGSAFYYDYHNYQSFAATTDGGLRIINVNARVKGLELSTTVRPARGLSITGAGTYLDTLQKNVPLPTGGTGRFQMPDAPRFSFSGEARYGFPLRGDDELAVQLDAAYVGQRSISAIDYPDQRIPSYHKLDARITYALPGRHWTLAAFANNFTNETIIATRVDFTTVTGAAVDTLDRPRWIGGSVTFRY